MITRDNLSEVVKSLDARAQNRLNNTTKEYCVIYLHTFNVGSYATITLTNDFDRYRNVSNNGDCILEVSEVIDIINS